MHAHLLICSLTTWGLFSLCEQVYFTLTAQDHGQQYAGGASWEPTRYTEDRYYYIIRSEIQAATGGDSPSRVKEG